MPCYYPVQGWKSRHVNPSGKRSIVFNAAEGFADMPVELPCGRCRGCRLENSRQWAMRCVHEASLHEENCFLTLTYAPEHMPSDWSLNKQDHQRFMKRLRRAFPREEGNRIRYFHCGEYGELNNRPHYHTLLFNFDFADRYLWTIKNGFQLYRSPTLERLWPFGHSLIGDVTFESAAYVARYVMKKITGDKAERHYQIFDPETGEIFQLHPEYSTMSRRPGIGKDWLLKYQSDTDKDYVTIRGMKMKLPKYYDTILEAQDELEFLNRKKVRKRVAMQHADDNTPQRLRAKEKVKEAQLNQLKRSYENEA